MIRRNPLPANPSCTAYNPDVCQINGENAQRIKLKTTRYQNTVSSDFANYLEDTLKIIETPKSNEKEPLISVTIHGESDRDEVKSVDPA